MRKRRTLWREASLLGAFLLLAAFETGIWRDLTTRCYGGGRGDPGQDGFILSRVSYQLLHEPWRPFEGNYYFPSHDSVLYCDPLLGPAVLVLPLRLVGANPVLLYNAAFLLSLTLASCGCYRLALRLGAAGLPALLAGIAIPYSGQQLARLFHLNLLTLTFFPFLIAGLVGLFERPAWRPALTSGAAFALQAATSGYHAFSSALIALVSLVWGVRSLRSPRTWAFSLLAAAFAGVLLYPYVSGFLWLREHEARMFRDAGVPAGLSLDLGFLFVSRAYLWRGLMPGPEPFFPGLVVVAFALLALRHLRRDRYVRLLAALAAASFLLALGPEIRWRGATLAPGPFAALRAWVPLLDAMRHPFSLAVPGLIALGLLASLGLSRSRIARSRLAVTAVLAAALVETLTDAPVRSPAPLGPPSVYSWLAGQPAGAVLELPFDDEAWTWWAAQHGLPIANGVGAFEPERYQILWQLFRHEWKGDPRDMEGSRSLEYLKAWFPLRYVIVHQDAAGTLKGCAAATSRSLRLLHETAEGDRVYLLRRGGSGPRIRRAYRDDQLGEGRLRVLLRGGTGTPVRASLNDSPLAELRLGPELTELAWTLPPGAVRRGLNVLELRVPEGGLPLELVDIEAR